MNFPVFFVFARLFVIVIYFCCDQAILKSRNNLIFLTLIFLFTLAEYYDYSFFLTEVANIGATFGALLKLFDSMCFDVRLKIS